jgi:hypothetical protein
MAAKHRTPTVHGVERDLRLLEKEGGDSETYCAVLADNNPELLLRALVEIYPEELREAYKNVLRDRPQLFVTRH